MASIQKTTYVYWVDAEGHRVKKGVLGARKVTEESTKWYARWKEGSKQVRIPLATDKTSSQVMLADVLRNKDRVKSGLINPFEPHLSQAVEPHVVDYLASIAASGKVKKGKYLAEKGRIFRHAGWDEIAPLSPKAKSRLPSSGSEAANSSVERPLGERPASSTAWPEEVHYEGASHHSPNHRPRLSRVDEKSQSCPACHFKTSRRLLHVPGQPYIASLAFGNGFTIEFRADRRLNFLSADRGGHERFGELTCECVNSVNLFRRHCGVHLSAADDAFSWPELARIGSGATFAGTAPLGVPGRAFVKYFQGTIEFRKT